MQEMFGEEDADASKGLSALEFQEAVDRWGGHCGYMRRSWFCSGGSMIRCCRGGWGWRKCGTVWHHHNCWGGGMGGAAWHGRAGWMQMGEKESQATPEEVAQQAAVPEATSGAKKDEVFLSMDADGDGELQLHELTGFLGGMGNFSAEDMQEMFGEEDADA